MVPKLAETTPRVVRTRALFEQARAGGGGGGGVVSWISRRSMLNRLISRERVLHRQVCRTSFVKRWVEQCTIRCCVVGRRGRNWGRAATSCGLWIEKVLQGHFFRMGSWVL